MSEAERSPELAAILWRGSEGWLERCVYTTFAHGSELVRVVLSGVAPPALRWFRAQGWIRPVKWNPSREQRFFGVGGTTVRAIETSKSEEHYPECWGWEPVPGTAAAALAWVEAARASSPHGTR